MTKEAVRDGPGPKGERRATRSNDERSAFVPRSQDYGVTGAAGAEVYQARRGLRMGSARASRAVFGAIAENLSDEKVRECGGAFACTRGRVRSPNHRVSLTRISDRVSRTALQFPIRLILSATLSPAIFV